jgi:hypothetical protein
MFETQTTQDREALLANVAAEVRDGLGRPTEIATTCPLKGAKPRNWCNASSGYLRGFASKKSGVVVPSSMGQTGMVMPVLDYVNTSPDESLVETTAEMIRFAYGNFRDSDYMPGTPVEFQNLRDGEVAALTMSVVDHFSFQVLVENAVMEKLAEDNNARVFDPATVLGFPDSFESRVELENMGIDGCFGTPHGGELVQVKTTNNPSFDSSKEYDVLVNAEVQDDNRTVQFETIRK